MDIASKHASLFSRPTYILRTHTKFFLPFPPEMDVKYANFEKNTSGGFGGGSIGPALHTTLDWNDRSFSPIFRCLSHLALLTLNLSFFLSLSIPAEEPASG